jgi:hypothetical protein
MTKSRAPLTCELALTKVAGLIGWAAAAEITGFKERTIRNWSDPDTSAEISLRAACQLDVAYRLAGGDGAPMLQCYAVRVDSDTLAATPDIARLQALVAHSAKEGGEATAASIIASRLDADDSDLAVAARELEESIAAQTSVLSMVRRLLCGPGAPGVAPPAEAEVPALG